MKKIVFLLLLSFVSSLGVKAQKFGYVDMEYITSKMPEYQKAQTEMNQFFGNAGPRKFRKRARKSTVCSVLTWPKRYF